MGYRKKIVFSNLALAFPDKTKADRKRIAKKFYKNFADTLVETIKLFSAGKKFLNRHMQGDYSVFDRLNEQEKKSQIHFGHNFNWEMANAAFAFNVQQTFLCVYMPLESKIFDRILKKLRSRTGSILISATDMRNSMMPHRKEIYTLGLVADQTPANPAAGYWINFFGNPTPFVRGPERGALAGNIPVIFGHITKLKRGVYQIHFEMAEEFPAGLKPGELTKRYVRYLERVIAAHPEMWLWSHRRWKHEWKPEYGSVLN